MCVVAVLLLAWIIGGLVGSADERPVHGTAASQDLVVAAPSSPAPSARAAEQSSTRAAPPTMSTAGPAPGGTPPRTGPPAPTGRATSRGPAPKPAPPRPCPDEVIKVVAEPEAESYRVGERPLLRLLVVNSGDVPCTRDVSRKLRELVITTADGRKRLWSSNDCYGPVEHDKRTLAPGQSLRLPELGRPHVRPGLPPDRTTVEAGTYRLTGKLGKLTSPPASLTLTE